MTEVSRGKLKLMVVDDEADNLDLLYRTFRREFEVFKANSGLNALDTLAQAGEMAIIISDQRMPKMNGTEFLSCTVEPYPDTIRILLTGYTDVEDLVGAINAGKVFKYITKPWNPDELKAVVQQAAETYRVVKQRTSELHRALHRESIFNLVTTAIRESLDYGSMLQTVVDTLGRTFAADTCMLYPVEPIAGVEPLSCLLSSEVFVYPAEEVVSQRDSANIPNPTDRKKVETLSSGCLAKIFAASQSQVISPGVACTELMVPLSYQQTPLAVLVLTRQASSSPWSAEEQHLIQAVAEQAALAISQAKLYQRIQQQTEQMRSELVVARQIQMNLLRQSWSTCDRVRVQAQCHPAREVGGDFFEVYVHPNNDVWLAVGDVSGKGVPAALFMASAISLLRRELSQETPLPPNIILQNLNSSLLDELVGSNCFITMVLACYSPVTRELVYANAGHIYPLVWSQDVVQERSSKLVEPNYLKVRGVPLGILPIWKAAAGHLTLDSGDVLLLTSDGITEATITQSPNEMLDRGTMLQQTGLWKLLTQQQGTLNLSDLITQIQACSPVQEDDQTILSLEVL
ncbi:MAG: hypothetical protein Kow00121_28010 [Elainellaceae cyanobacterium]